MGKDTAIKAYIKDKLKEWVEKTKSGWLLWDKMELAICGRAWKSAKYVLLCTNFLPQTCQNIASQALMASLLQMGIVHFASCQIISNLQLGLPSLHMLQTIKMPTRILLRFLFKE